MTSHVEDPGFELSPELPTCIVAALIFFSSCVLIVYMDLVGFFFFFFFVETNVKTIFVSR